MVLKVSLKFPPTLALVDGWLFPESSKGQERPQEFRTKKLVCMLFFLPWLAGHKKRITFHGEKLKYHPFWGSPLFCKAPPRQFRPPKCKLTPSKIQIGGALQKRGDPQKGGTLDSRDFTSPSRLRGTEKAEKENYPRARVIWFSIVRYCFAPPSGRNSQERF